MLTEFASTGRVFRAGDVVDVGPATAARLIERGFAAPDRQPPVEHAVIVAPERAVKQRRKGRRHVDTA